MCGIAAYCGQGEAAPFIIEGLKRLEYRGYDSWGVAISKSHSQLPYVHQAIGAVSTSNEACIRDIFNMCGTVGIGHTRWATHGAVELKNAHPIRGGKIWTSCYLVHNGIIENHLELRQWLTGFGYLFETTTDSEVIADLFDFYLRESRVLDEAIRKTMNRLEGQYSFVILPVEHPGKLVLACKGSPLLLTTEGHIASDPTAFIGHSNYFYRMKDNEWRIVDSQARNFDISSDQSRTSYPLELVPLKTLEQEKGDDPHYMLKEIKEQPVVLAKEHCDIPFNLNPSRVVLFGCGSSYHAAMLGKFYFERYAHIPAEVEYSCELQDSELTLYPKDTLFIALTQSGETRDAISALEKIRQNFPVDNVMLITNSEHCSAMCWARHLILLEAGLERGVAATKTFTAQVACLLHTAIHLKKAPWVGDLVRKVLGKELPTKITEILGHSDNIKYLGQICSRYKNILYMGRGWNYPVALEGALKMKEVSYIHAEAIHAGEMKHGPIALIDDSTLSIFLVTRGFNKRILSNMQEIKARNGRILAVVEKGMANDVFGLVDYMVVMPKCGEAVQPIVTSVVLQLLAYYAAVELGRNVDRPRNLAKSVTVE